MIIMWLSLTCVIGERRSILILLKERSLEAFVAGITKKVLEAYIAVIKSLAEWYFLLQRILLHQTLMFYHLKTRCCMNNVHVKVS